MLCIIVTNPNICSECESNLIEHQSKKDRITLYNMFKTKLYARLNLINNLLWFYN